MDSIINRKCMQFLFNAIPNNIYKNIYWLRPSPTIKSLVQVNRNYRKFIQYKFKSNEIKTYQIRKCIARSSTLSRISCRCLVKYNKGNSKVSLIGNIKSSEKNLSSSEAPVVHYASSGFVFDLQKSFLSNKLKSSSNLTSGSLDIILNELELLKETRQCFLHLNPRKEDLILDQNIWMLGQNRMMHRMDEGDNPQIIRLANQTIQENEIQKTISAPIVEDSPINRITINTGKTFYVNLPKYYASLAKSRLTGLVVLTSMAGYVIAPAMFNPGVFLACSLGTALTSSSANSINQFFEIPFDSKMNRTKNRVLVRGLLTPLHAITFGAVCGGIGITVLYFGVNELTAVLGALNLIIYTSIYTPLKQMSIVNTWVGSVVGAIPPMMGWAACTGSLAPGAIIMGGMLYAWQFPHFNALSWNIKHDYGKAGYKMMAITHPDLCRRTALRYSASLIVLSTLAPIYDVTTWTFAMDSLPLNLYFTYLAWRFYKEADSKSSRKLFRFSLFHLPALLLLMIMSKKEIPNKEPLSTNILEDSNSSVSDSLS